MDENDATRIAPGESIRGSVVALMSNIVDYAGLFPPAKLDMATTVKNYASYLAGRDAWMIERLVVPVNRLDEFEEHAAPLLPTDNEDEFWQLTAEMDLAGEKRIQTDIRRIERFNDFHMRIANGSALIDFIEMRVDCVSTVDAMMHLVPDEVLPFFEIAPGTDPRGLIATLVGIDAGARIRTGGESADLYPSADHLARFIAACAAADVPFKAAAGLHHPLTHDSRWPGVKEFGFLNVFLAAALAYMRGAEENELVQVLGEESIEAFTFEDEAVRWRDETLTAEEIEGTRLAFAVSFGSCSFDEPRGDLQALGLL